MAPKTASKRGATTVLGAAKKKVAKETRPAAQCAVVTEALVQADLPEDVRQLLSACAATSLAEPCDVRHPWQAEMVQWIGGALAGIEASVAQQASEALAKLDEVGVEGAKREAALSGAEDDLVKLQEAVQEAEAKKAEAIAAQRAAEKTLKEASSVAASGETELVELSATEAELRSVMAESGSYATWKSEAASSEAVEDFSALLQKHGFEPGLVQSVPLVLTKAPDARTAFSSMVLQQFEAAAEKRLAGLAEMQALATPAQAERVAAVAASEEALNATKAEVEVATAAEQEAQLAVKHGDVAVKEAKKALKEQALAVKQVQAAEKAASVASAVFTQGPLATFRQLEERTTVVETEDQPQDAMEVEPQTEEPAKPEQAGEPTAQSEQQVSPDEPAPKVMQTETPAVADPMLGGC